MTCIVGIQEKGRVLIGGDSAASTPDGSFVTILSDKKVFKTGKFLIGFTSSYRMGQLLRFSFRPPRKPAGCDDINYLATIWIDSVRELFKENGFGKDNQGEEFGGNFIFGYNKTLYEVQCDYHVAVPHLQYCSVGSGAHYAYGSLHSTVGQKSEKRIEKALNAAAEFSAGVRPPFYLMEI